MAGRVAQLVALVLAASAYAQTYGPVEPGTRTAKLSSRSPEPGPIAGEAAPAAEESADTPQQGASGGEGLDTAPAHERVALPAVERGTEPATGERPDPAGGPGWLGVLGPLALVVILIVGAGLLIRRAARASGGLVASLGAGGRAPAGLLEVLGRYPVGMGQTLVLLKIDRRVLLLAQSRAGRLGGASFTTLAEFTDPDEVASLLMRARDEAGESLAERFRSALRTFGPDELPVTTGPADGPVASVRRRLDAPARGCGVRLAVLVLSLLLAAPLARAQEVYGPSPDPPAAMNPDAAPVELPGTSGFSRDAMNPISVVGSAAEILGGDDEPGLSAAINIMVLLTVLTLVPSIMLMCTCFLRILIVLGLLKQAMGTNSLPPSQVVTGLALFMTLVVMSPTIDRIWEEAVVPYNNGQIRDYDELWTKAKQPLRDFMFDQIEVTGNWSSLYMVLEHRGFDVSDPAELTRADVDMVSLVPAYMLSELKVSFLMGFRVYLPFLVIDMVIASMLISMSMMMLPPVLISLPFKLMLFVMVDGWALVVGNLMGSFERGGAATAMLTPEHWPALATLYDHAAMVAPTLG